MFEWLQQMDLAVLQFVNVGMAHPVLDQFWLGITQVHKQLWFQAVLLPLLLGWLVYIYRMDAVKLVLSLALAIGLADTLAYRGIKSVINRQRPFQNLEISWLRKVGQAHGPSFPSNHAANVFAGAVVLAWHFTPVGYIFYILAGLVSVSRIALGVHYPSDVLAGMMLGIFVGLLIRFLLLQRIAWFRMRKHVSGSDASTSA